jgi:hypothetical protein
VEDTRVCRAQQSHLRSLEERIHRMRTAVQQSLREQQQQQQRLSDDAAAASGSGGGGGGGASSPSGHGTGGSTEPETTHAAVVASLSAALGAVQQSTCRVCGEVVSVAFISIHAAVCRPAVSAVSREHCSRVPHSPCRRRDLCCRRRYDDCERVPVVMHASYPVPHVLRACARAPTRVPHIL